MTRCRGIDNRLFICILNMNIILCVVELVFLLHISIVETAEDIFSLKNNHLVYFFENCVSLLKILSVMLPFNVRWKITPKRQMKDRAFVKHS